MSLVIEEFQKNRFSNKYVMAVVILTSIIGGVLVFPVSFVSHSNFIIGVLLFPFVILVNGKPRINYIYIGIILIFAALAWIYHLRIFYLFLLQFFILFLVEYYSGRTNPLVVFLFIFMAPIFQQIEVILGFPFRLKLTEGVGTVLQMSGWNVSVEGNALLLNGTAFYVDQACAGLNMLSVSMIIGVFIAAFYYRTLGRSLSAFKLFIIFGYVFLLNQIANFLRILFLVIFKIGPDEWMHEAIGILCFLIYIILPLIPALRTFINKTGNPVEIEKVFPRPVTSQHCYILLFSCGLLLFLATEIRKHRNENDGTHAEVFYKKHEIVKIRGGVSKIITSDALIYVKPIPEFFSGEHTPLICWKGSGYRFQGLKPVAIVDNMIYTGTLVRNGAILHTAWWYTDGKSNTISQWEWRKKMFFHKTKYYLVNVTCADQQVLKKVIREMMVNNLLDVKQVQT